MTIPAPLLIGAVVVGIPLCIVGVIGICALIAYLRDPWTPG